MKDSSLNPAESEKKGLVYGFPARHHAFTFQCDTCLKKIEPGTTFHMVRRVTDYSTVSEIGIYCHNCIGQI